MASFTTLVKKVSNARARQTTAFIRRTIDDGGGIGVDTYEYKTFGRIKNAGINFEPVVTEKDTAGREIELAWDVTATFVMMQTTDDEIAVMGSLAEPDDNATLYDNGYFVFFSDEPQTTSTVYLGEADGLPSVLGFGFDNVLIKPTLSVQLNAEESMITIEFSGRIGRDALDTFNLTDGNILTFDA